MTAKQFTLILKTSEISGMRILWNDIEVNDYQVIADKWGGLRVMNENGREVTAEVVLEFDVNDFDVRTIIPKQDGRTV